MLTIVKYAENFQIFIDCVLKYLVHISNISVQCHIFVSSTASFDNVQVWFRAGCRNCDNYIIGIFCAINDKTRSVDLPDLSNLAAFLRVINN